MKKMKLSLLPIAVIILAFGCTKDPVAPPKEEPREPTEIIKDIVGNLATADSISVFVDKLKELPLSAADVEEGITVFAPLNSEDAVAKQALVMERSPAGQTFAADDLTPDVIKDHIVKGVIKLKDLTNDRILISLSGKELKVSRVGNKIWINGIQIGSEEIGATEDQVVYTVKELLSNTTVEDELQTTSLEVVVWDASAWTPEAEKGTLASGATVKLYKSQADFTQGISVYDAETDDEGKAIFADISPETYFVGVEYGDKSNVFYGELQEDGVWVGMVSTGIFQSQQAIEAAPQQPDARIGNFQWKDHNSDGVITLDDRVPLPYESVEVNDGRIKTIEIFVGYGDNSAHKPLSAEEFADQLQSIVQQMDEWRMRLAVGDAVLSGQVSVDSLSGRLANDYREWSNFSFSPLSPSITNVWGQGYGLIARLNQLEPRTDDIGLSAQLRLARAYVYLQLMTYFGNIPSAQGVAPGELTNTDSDMVYEFVKDELRGIEGMMPNDGGRISGSKSAVQALLIRVALLRKDYDLASAYSSHLIEASNYQLVASGARFDVQSPEHIWNTLTITDEIRAYFFNRPSFPILRYSEVLLAGAEANLGLGNTRIAIDYLNQLIARDGGMPVSDTLSNAKITARLRSTWNKEMNREGTTFANYVRWGVAADSLSHRGFRPAHRVLPTPQSVLDANPNMLPTSGY